MKKPWFQVRPFWGWYPITWQGFAIIITMFFAIIYIMYSATTYSSNVFNIFILAFPFICLIISSTMLTALLTGEKPKFGIKNKELKNYSPDNPSAYLLLACLSLSFGLYYFANRGYIGSLIFLINFLLIYKIYLLFSKHQSA